MRQLLASIGALMLAVAMLMTASGLFGTFLGLRSSLEGFSKEWVGLLMSAHYGGLVLGALRCGRLINRIGHIRAFAAFCAMAAAFSCLFPFVVHPVVWVLLRSAIGFNMAGMFMVVESWLTTQASDRTRGTALSIYMMVTYLAAGSGPLLINLADPAGQELFLLAVMLFALALVPVAVTRTRAPVPVEAAHFGLRRLYAISPLAVIGCIGAGLVCGAAYGMGPVFAQSLGLRVAEISGFMSVLQVSGLLLQLPLGRLSDRYDRRSVLTLATLALALVSLAIVALMLWHSLSDIGGQHPPAGFWRQYGWLLMTLVGGFGGFSATLYPLAVAYANDYIDAQDRVQAAGGLLLSYSIAAAAGPVLAAALMRPLGPLGLFAFCAAIGLGVCGFALYRMRRRHWVPVMAKESFKVLPEASATPLPPEIGARGAEAMPAGGFGENAADMPRPASAGAAEASPPLTRT